MTPPSLSLLGATGNVGRKTLELLLNAGIRPSELALFASRKRHLEIAGEIFDVHPSDQATFKKNDIVILNTETDVSCLYAPKALEAGAYVVDSSSHYRLNAQVPLIVPGVNDHEITRDQFLYAHTNCVVSPLALVLETLKQVQEIERVVVSTYQSTSGAGKAAQSACIEESQLFLSSHDHVKTSDCFTRPIAFNVIPQIGSFAQDGISSEEQKIVQELEKVLGDTFSTQATAVRVPVLVGHSSSVLIDFKTPINAQDLHHALEKNKDITFLGAGYVTPIEVEGASSVFVGRFRQVTDRTILLWIVSDNLIRGAALDSAMIALALKKSLDNLK